MYLIRWRFRKLDFFRDRRRRLPVRGSLSSKNWGNRLGQACRLVRRRDEYLFATAQRCNFTATGTVEFLSRYREPEAENRGRR